MREPVPQGHAGPRPARWKPVRHSRRGLAGILAAGLAGILAAGLAGILAAGLAGILAARPAGAAATLDAPADVAPWLAA